ncbi:MAG: thioredoxin family protein [Candidatus Aenigmarchaeota archaeon]|nr:thioredoxin family protein [Candidatus Aenigmarchaeota archaeon]
MPKQNALASLLLLSIVFIAGCTANQTDRTLEDGTIVKSDGTMIKPDGTMVKPENQSMNKTNETMMKESSYQGTVLAGNSAKLLDFTKSDYDKALNSDKTIVLYFYANWCPICREEVPELYSAFNGLTTDKVVGFRVHFNDDHTYDNERALARQFGVPYQHTKVFIKNGKNILKSAESWDKQRYLDEINKVI